jgi:hypothetical protein
MEYLNHRGAYADLPLEKIIRTFREEYGTVDAREGLERASFDEDVGRETR